MPEEALILCHLHQTLSKSPCYLLASQGIPYRCPIYLQRPHIHRKPLRSFPSQENLAFRFIASAVELLPCSVRIRIHFYSCVCVQDMAGTATYPVHATCQKIPESSWLQLEILPFELKRVRWDPLCVYS